MALFSKKKTEEKTAKTAPAAQTATKNAATKPAPVEKKAPAAKQMPVAKAITAASASKATAQKTASKASSAPKASAKNTTAAKSAPKPFFLSGKDDIKELFDQAIAEADYEILKNGAKTAGKYEFELEVDGYHFYLIANNGQILFDSPSFTTLLGALGGAFLTVIKAPLLQTVPPSPINFASAFQPFSSSGMLLRISFSSL